ncbi:Putative secreted protein [Listeria seeligeri]
MNVNKKIVWIALTLVGICIVGTIIAAIMSVYLR